MSINRRRPLSTCFWGRAQHVLFSNIVVPERDRDGHLTPTLTVGRGWVELLCHSRGSSRWMIIQLWFYLHHWQYDASDANKIKRSRRFTWFLWVDSYPQDGGKSYTNGGLLACQHSCQCSRAQSAQWAHFQSKRFHCFQIRCRGMRFTALSDHFW